jgi:DNA-binding CsgD family transcriptional regulator
MLKSMGERAGNLSPGLREQAVVLADGNPFHLEELVRAALETGDDRSAIAVPRSVNEAVRRRVLGLDDGARQTLTLAAVAGRRFDFALLQAMSGHDLGTILRHLRELIAAGLVIEEPASAAAPDGQFAFRHALTRQAIYTGLLAPERRALHQAIFDELRRTGNALDRRLPDLARHSHEAGIWEEAHIYGRQAGEQALARHAPRAAVEHFTRAIEAIARLGTVASPFLHRQRGRAFDILGEFDAARRDYEVAIHLARANGDRAEEGAGQRALGQLWLGRDYATAGAYLHAARDTAEHVADRAVLAHCLNQVGNWHLNLDRPAEAFRCHDEALAIFEAAGDRPGIAESLDLLAMTRYLTGDVAGSARIYRRAIDLLRELDDRQTLSSSLANLAAAIGNFDNREVAPAEGSEAECRRYLDEAVALAREIGSRAGEVYALCNLAFVEGRHSPALALDLAGQALRLAEEIGHAQWGIRTHHLRGLLYAALLDLPAAERELELAQALATELRSTFWNFLLGADLASVLVQRRELDRAAQVLDAVQTDETPLVSFAQRRAWLIRGELTLAQGQPSRALSIVDRLLGVAFGGVEAKSERVPHLGHLKGRALLALDRVEEASAELRAARDGAFSTGLPSLLWQVHLALGECAQRLSDRAGADQEFAAARLVVDSLAATIENEAMRETFMRNALTRFPHARPPTARQATKAAFSGLTERERAVAALIAEGLTNREIGESLYMSKTTVATHVGNILGKLGMKTRAQVAAWAKAHNLARPGDP